MKKIYISGKISGIEALAPLLFEIAEKLLQKEGFETVNPLTINHNHDLSWESYMKVDIKEMCSCDSIYLLKNWYNSRGAIIEHDLAKKLKFEMIYEKELTFFQKIKLNYLRLKIFFGIK